MTQATQTNEELVAQFVRGMDVRDAGADVFIGASDREEGRLFGGLVLAQAAIAAGRTVPEATIHSLHAYFLRAGRPDETEYHVERVRDGRSFTSRRVLARQDGRAICDITASFVHPEDGISHQEPMPDAPDPETLRDARDEFPWEGGEDWPAGPVEWRLIEPPDRIAKPGESTIVREWMRMRAPLPDDPSVHAAALAFFSDAGSFSGIERIYGWKGFSHKASASLDHAMWFHRPWRWDGWMLMVTHTPVAHASRALTLRYFYTQDGTHVGSMAQEAIFRRERTP